MLRAQQHIEHIFKRLFQAAEKRPVLSKPLFDETLFQCKSVHIKDYICEAQQHWLTLLQQSQATPHQDELFNERLLWLHEHATHQLEALVRALL